MSVSPRFLFFGSVAGEAADRAAVFIAAAVSVVRLAVCEFLPGSRRSASGV